VKKKLTADRVFALRGHTIKVENGKYFTAPTLNQSKWSGPYKSLQHATTAIARKLQREFEERNKKLETFHAQH
jgi:hypothetical protein